MGFAVRGLTHCKECYSPLEQDEYGLCKQCENKQEKEQEKDKQIDLMAEQLAGLTIWNINKE